MFANPDNCSQFFFFEKTSSKKCGLEICAGIKFIIGREGKEGGTRRIDDQTILHYACIN